jgi:hypothetical protein
MNATTDEAMREWEYEDHVNALRQADALLAAEVGGFTGIKSVLDWIGKRGLAKAHIDIVGQDEFHYDFLIEVEPGGRWAAFGVT